MILQSSSTRFLVLRVSMSSFIILYLSASYVTGQPVLTTGLANCGDDVMLTCSQPGFTNTAGRLWKKGGVTIFETGKDASTADRYSEKSTSNDFSLVISNAMLEDADNYTCEYQFVPSSAEFLPFECKPTELGVDVTRNNQKKLYIQINDIYPSSIIIDVECALQGESSKAIIGTREKTTQNGDHFDVTWMSDNTISAGTYTCTITLVTRTSTEIVKNGLTFSDPSTEDDKTGLKIGLGVGLTVAVVLCITIVIIRCWMKKALQQGKQLKIMQIRKILDDSRKTNTDLGKTIDRPKAVADRAWAPEATYKRSRLNTV